MMPAHFCFTTPAPVLSSSTHAAQNVCSFRHNSHRYVHRYRMSADALPPLPSPIAFIGGGGNMGSAIITGLLQSRSADAVPIIIASSPKLASLSSLPIPASNKTTSNLSAASGAAMVFLCVKPNIAPQVLQEISPAFDTDPSPTLVSVVTGLSTAAMEDTLGLDYPPPIVRSMPNIPAAVGAAVTGVCCGSAATVEHVNSACAVLNAVGDVAIVPEKLFAAVTGVSGAGVAYLFMVAEALADAAVGHGISRDVAKRLAAGTVYGAGKLLLEGAHPALLRNSVESPGGLTVCGTAELERQGVRAAFIDAVGEVVKKAKSMGDA